MQVKHAAGRPGTTTVLQSSGTLHSAAVPKVLQMGCWDRH